MARKPTGGKNGRPFKWGLDLMQVGEIKRMKRNECTINGQTHVICNWSHMSTVYKAQKRTGFVFQTWTSGPDLMVRRIK